MRLVVNLIKFLSYLVLLAAVLLLTGAIALTHYQGEVAGLELMAFENMPLGRDPLVGWMFEAITPTAGFANWTALGITGLIIVLSFLACHHAMALIRLLLAARTYIREGHAADLWRTVADHSLPFFFAVALLVPLLMGDMALFQYRALYGVLAPEDAKAAAQSIPAVGALLPQDFNVATIAFLSGNGMLMYLAMGVAPAVALELVGGLMGQTLAKIADEVSAIYRQWSGPTEADADADQVLYGYAASGQPVFDPAAPIAYDVDQNPVAPANPAGPPASGDDWTASNDTNAFQDAAALPAGAAEAAASQDRPMPVFGGTDSEEVTFADALAQPDRFYITRNPRAVYAKPYWDALQAEPTADPRPQSTTEPKKEAA